MKIERCIPWAFATSFVLCACSGGGSDGASDALQVLSVVQDLDLDADGLTTVITLEGPIASIDTPNVEADGGQTAISAVLVDDEITVTWDERVTPSHEVRILGKPGVDSSPVAVTTTDDSSPTFAVTSGDQIAGLGGDLISVAFSGPRVIESEVEDLANWTLEVGGETLDLTGSSFDFDAATQTLSITTGPMANLHASFSLAASGIHSVADVDVDGTAQPGVAVGDTVAPNLVSAEQNLSEDDFGRVVDFTFDEAMDPVFAAQLAHFVTAAPDVAFDVTQPAAEVLRVTFNNPMVPGVNTVDLENLVDAHGNAMTDLTTALAAGSTVANAWASAPDLVTVANAGGDYLLADFVQALDPDTAADPAHWELVIDPSGAATTVDLSTATLDFDLLTKTLRIDLADDLITGDDFSFASDPLDPPIDVDGQDFVSSYSGTIAGDSGAPTLVTAVQNRYVDPDGATIDVTFSEDVDESAAETLGNWSVTGATVISATLLAAGDSVRIELDHYAVPGSDTLGVSGIGDLAGNLMAAVSGRALTSTDQRDPEIVTAVATAVEGADDDTLAVSLTDAMIESEIEDVANWTVESPVGVALDLSSSAVVWSAASRTATLTLSGADLQTDDDFEVTLATMRDIGGNTVSNAAATGDVDAETTLPTLVSAWVESAVANELHLRFSEPCQHMDDVAGATEYVVRNAAGVAKGSPVSATEDADRLGVELVFAFAVVAGSDTLDAAGVLDLAGNPLFPVADFAIASEDSSEVAVDGGSSLVTTVSGERNDVLQIVFDRAPSPWQLLDPAHYALDVTGTPVDISGASLSFDGASTVTIVLDAIGAESLATGSVYTLTVSDVQSAQGVDMSASSTAAVMAAGDATAPTLPSGRARLDAVNPTTAVLIEMDEAIDATDAVTTALIALNGATQPDTAELLGARTVRATFSGGVSAGDTVDVGFHDLAQNLGIASRAVSAADVAGPLVVSVQGTAVAGAGGDLVTVVYNKPVDEASALSAGNYTVTNGAAAIALAGARLTYASGSNTVTIELAAGSDLDPDDDLNVQVSDVYDHAGLAISPSANVNGDVDGDATAPDFAAAFVNYRADALGFTLDVLFDEDVDETPATDLAAWTASGGQAVESVERRSGRHYRVTLDSPLASGETLGLTGLADPAGNVAGSLSIAPWL